jgi:hypothetical protein
MDVALVRKIPFLLLRDGRYYARRVVSQELRSIIGKNELREPLGSDRRLAIERLPIAMVKINAQIDHARMALAAQLERDGKALAARSAPMSEDELARMHYQERLDLDLALRDLSDFWAGRSIGQPPGRSLATRKDCGRGLGLWAPSTHSASMARFAGKHLRGDGNPPHSSQSPALHRIPRLEAHVTSIAIIRAAAVATPRPLVLRRRSKHHVGEVPRFGHPGPLSDFLKAAVG